MIDDFHSDTSRLWFLKGARDVAVERGPGFFVDLGLEGGLQSTIGIVRSKEIGLTDEEALFVVIGIYEPAGDAVSSVADDFAGLRFEHIYAVDLDPNLAIFFFED